MLRSPPSWKLWLLNKVNKFTIKQLVFFCFEQQRTNFLTLCCKYFSTIRVISQNLSKNFEVDKREALKLWRPSRQNQTTLLVVNGTSQNNCSLATNIIIKVDLTILLIVDMKANAAAHSLSAFHIYSNYFSRFTNSKHFFFWISSKNWFLLR